MKALQIVRHVRHDRLRPPPPYGISPAPDPLYIKAITGNAKLETIFLNMHDSGVGVTLKKR